jgi:hypothetical protein
MPGSLRERGLSIIGEMLGEAAKARMEQNAAAGFGARFTQLAIDFAFGTMWAADAGIQVERLLT